MHGVNLIVKFKLDRDPTPKEVAGLMESLSNMIEEGVFTGELGEEFSEIDWTVSEETKP